jgi:hypothetical protein
MMSSSQRCPHRTLRGRGGCAQRAPPPQQPPAPPPAAAAPHVAALARLTALPVDPASASVAELRLFAREAVRGSRRPVLSCVCGPAAQKSHGRAVGHRSV